MMGGKSKKKFTGFFSTLFRRKKKTQPLVEQNNLNKQSHSLVCDIWEKGTPANEEMAQAYPDTKSIHYQPTDMDELSHQAYAPLVEANRLHSRTENLLETMTDTDVGGNYFETQDNNVNAQLEQTMLDSYELSQCGSANNSRRSLGDIPGRSKHSTSPSGETLTHKGGTFLPSAPRGKTFLTSLSNTLTAFRDIWGAIFAMAMLMYWICYGLISVIQGLLAVLTALGRPRVHTRNRNMPARSLEDVPVLAIIVFPITILIWLGKALSQVAPVTARAAPSTSHTYSPQPQHKGPGPLATFFRFLLKPRNTGYSSSFPKISAPRRVGRRIPCKRCVIS